MPVAPSNLVVFSSRDFVTVEVRGHACFLYFDASCCAHPPDASTYHIDANSTL